MSPCPADQEVLAEALRILCDSDLNEFYQSLVEAQANLGCQDGDQIDRLVGNLCGEGEDEV